MSTITTHTRQDNPYRLRAALAGVIGSRVLTTTYEHSECIQTRRLGLPPPPPKHTHRLQANRQRDAARRRQQTPEQLADNRQRHATRRQQETTQAREARCVCIRPWVCVSVYMYPSCARWLVAKKFGCKRAHINYYDNNTHEAGQSLPASRGADGRTTITRLTTTYEHSECIQTRRLGLPPPQNTHTGCG